MPLDDSGRSATHDQQRPDPGLSRTTPRDWSPSFVQPAHFRALLVRQTTDTVMAPSWEAQRADARADQQERQGDDPSRGQHRGRGHRSAPSVSPIKAQQPDLDDATRGDAVGKILRDPGRGDQQRDRTAAAGAAPSPAPIAPRDQREEQRDGEEDACLQEELEEELRQAAVQLFVSKMEGRTAAPCREPQSASPAR